MPNPIPARLIAIVGGSVLLILAFWLAMHFYGASKYKEGVTAEDAKWQAGSEQLKRDAGNAADNADMNATSRQQNEVANRAADQAAVNAAEAEGKSPFDVLFGN